MNKIVLDNKSIINIKIKEDSICNIDKSYKIDELNIELLDDVKLIVNQYSDIISANSQISIKQNNNSEFIYNHSFINKKEYNLDINIKLVGNNSKNIINIHGVSDNGITNVNVDGKIPESTKDNELLENIKLININDGKSYINPNMFIDTKNVSANHAASISTINSDYLLYLMSRGISESDAKNLLIDGFLENAAR